MGCASFPFDGSRWLRGYIIEDSVDTVYVVDDGVGDCLEDVVGQGVGLCGHAVGGGNGTQTEGILIRAFIAHDAHGAHR